MGDILDYLDDLTARLEGLSQAERIRFTVWATQRVLSRAQDALKERVGEDVVSFFKDRLVQLEQSVTSKRPLDRETLKHWRDSAKTVSWDADWIDLEGQYRDFLAVEAVEALVGSFETGVTGSSKSAAHAAERALNIVDFELLMLEDVQDPLSHRRFRAELQIQMEKLDELMRVHSRLPE